MTSTFISQQPARNAYQPLSSRASSATLILSHLAHDHIDGAADPFDMIIAQGLLQPESPRIPRRRSSFSHSTKAQKRHLLGSDDENPADGGYCYDRSSRQGFSSNTWTSSSGCGSEDDGSDDRTLFVQEYNRLAKKYGVQLIVPDEFIAVHVDKVTVSAKPGSWIMRKILKRTSSIQAYGHKTEKQVRHRRSVSDISLRIRTKKDNLKGKDLAELVRLCGASALYLPAEYAAGTLAVPTCFRATAQYLVQHAATTRGIFRIPGAHSTINALYNHYASQDEDGEVINGTVRCPTLPEHIQCNVHDVASAFKKFLSGLPGGILGKTWLFDAFVSIYCQLDSAAELMRTKQGKLRARLIALAIATVAPRYQRELICAVLGLLSMVGRAAETAPREDEHGRPLPTSDLMGYGALGTVFGPLLIGDLLDHHGLHPTIMHSSSAFTHRSPPKSSRGMHRKSKGADDLTTLPQNVDKIRLVNSITEMLIMHWRDVVRHMRNFGALRFMKQDRRLTGKRPGSPSSPLASEAFSLRRPRDWDAERTSRHNTDRSRSPTPPSRNNQADCPTGPDGRTRTLQDDVLSVRKRVSRPRLIPSQILSGTKSMSILAPTIEENTAEDRQGQQFLDSDDKITPGLDERDGVKAIQSTQTLHTTCSKLLDMSNQKEAIAAPEEATISLAKRVLILPGTRAKEFKSLPDNGEGDLNSSFQNFEEQTPSMEDVKTFAIGMKSPFTQENRASPAQDGHKLFEQSRAMFSPLGSPKIAQAGPKDSSQVPVGIVSNHLRRMTASEPGRESPSVFRGLWKTRHKVSPLSKRSSITPGNSNTAKSNSKDQLTRVSQEEDVTSLASLAEVIQSQADVLYINPPSIPDIPSNVNKPDARSVIPDPFASGSHIVKSVLKTTSQESPEEQLQVTENTMLPSNMRKLPITPNRSAPEPGIPGRSGGNSVRELAARFNNAETNTRPTPSPSIILDPRHFYLSPIEKVFVSPYTVGTSLIPMSLPLKGSGKSIQATHNNAITVMRHSDASANQLHDRTSYRPDNPSPQWPKLNLVEGRAPTDPSLIRIGRGDTAPSPYLSNLHRTGDGNLSLTISPKPCSGTVLPIPDGPPLPEFMEYPRMSATHSEVYSPSSFYTPSCGISRRMSNSSFVGPMHGKQNTSVLYSQIQYLHRQLKAKEDESEHLRRRLVTKDSLYDLGTLSQQLSQTKRDLAIWRGRAEVAEKRLEALSRLRQKGKGEIITDEQLATEPPGNIGLRSTWEDRLEDRARKLPRKPNGINSDEGSESLESEGTIQRTTHEHEDGANTELEMAKEEQPKCSLS